MERRIGKRIGALGLSLLLAAGVLGVLAAVGPAGATLPGGNGKIAYANGGIWVAGPGGEDPTRLTSSIMDADPSWSPDGTRIAFTRLNGCREPECVFGDVWVMDADGTDQSLVTKGFNPSWSPDGERLAYESCATSGLYPCDNDKRNVSLVNPDGTGRVDLTAGMRSSCNANTTSREVEPAWSPDGGRIAFVSSAERCRNEVYAMDADGTGKVRLSEAGVNEADSTPSWSPDGEEIVFSRSYEAEMPRVYSVDADGVLGEVAFPNARGLEPAWSPDGRRIAYRATPGNALTSVTVTGEATPLGTTGAAPDWQTIPNTRPSISAPKPAPGSRVRDTTPLLSAVVTDKETDLQTSDIKLYVDGRPKSFSYSPATDKLTHKSAKLKPGSHAAKVVVKDEGGLAATKNWNFKVVR
jgi:dipeptidyl aminopeptidase/acylaminoacyl peptidase